MIFETHAHYDDAAFDEDRDDLLKEIEENGITHVVNVAANIEGIKNAGILSRKYPFIYGTVGVHPNEVMELTKDKLAWMKEMCNQDKIVAVGEIGLDYYYDEPAKDIQKYWFIEQMHLAKEVGLPIIIHSRDAANDTLELLKQNKWTDMTGVIHCFSYSKEMADEYCNLGFYIGIGGVITFSNARKLKETVQHVSLDKIVLETDSPYLAPVPNRGKRNSSLNLPAIAKEIAVIKGITYDEVVKTTYENAKRLYRL